MTFVKQFSRGEKISFRYQQFSVLYCQNKGKIEMQLPVYVLPVNLWP